MLPLIEINLFFNESIDENFIFKVHRLSNLFWQVNLEKIKNAPLNPVSQVCKIYVRQIEHAQTHIEGDLYIYF